MEGLIETDAIPCSAQEVDTFQNFLLGLGAKPFELGDSTLETSLPQMFQVRDAELVIQGFGLLGSHAG